MKGTAAGGGGLCRSPLPLLRFLTLEWKSDATRGKITRRVSDCGCATSTDCVRLIVPCYKSEFWPSVTVAGLLIRQDVDLYESLYLEACAPNMSVKVKPEGRKVCKL